MMFLVRRVLLQIYHKCSGSASYFGLFFCASQKKGVPLRGEHKQAIRLIP